jgi:hypothetical protein
MIVILIKRDWVFVAPANVKIKREEIDGPNETAQYASKPEDPV